jgi:hypothetical protein
MRWVLLPAADAGLDAMVRSRALALQAKDAVNEAKSCAAELPDELIGMVRQSTVIRPSTGANRRKSTTSRR